MYTILLFLFPYRLKKRQRGHYYKLDANKLLNKMTSTFPVQIIGHIFYYVILSSFFLRLHILKRFITNIFVKLQFPSFYYFLRSL